MTDPDPRIEAAARVLRRQLDALISSDRCLTAEDVAKNMLIVADRAAWRPIGEAPKDGNAFLAYGQHIVDDPPGAQRGVKAGDHWWAIVLWDIWRSPQWVFSKTGEPTWSKPTHFQPLPSPPEPSE